MAKRTPARSRGKGRGRAAKAKQTKKTNAERSSALTVLRERIRGGFGRHADDFWGVLLLVLGTLLALASFHLAGPAGEWLASGLRLLFGVWAHAIPPALIGLGIALVLINPRSAYRRVLVGFIVTFVSSLALFHLMTGTVSLAKSTDLVRERGGAIGSLLAFPMRRLIGFWGAFVVLIAFAALGVLMLTRTTLRDVGLTVASGVRRLRRSRHSRRNRYRVKVIESRAPQPIPQRSSQIPPRPNEAPPRPAAPPQKAARPAGRSTQHPIAAQRRMSAFEKPPLDLLAVGGGAGHNKRSLDETARELEDTLLQHGVDARLTRIVPGPTVTRFEIELAPGVKVARVTGLARDIAYALATPDVRILAPIPGRSAIGVEVPNRRRRIVTLGDILREPEAEAATHPLTVGLGMNISGRPVMLNLHELPHVLIAGATGAGKSSCINAMVMSLLMRTTPERVRLILIDPKRVELGHYNDVPHLLTRVITNPKKAADALQWAVREMDRRYDLLAEAGVRDVDGYYEHIDAGALDPDRFDRFPYVVVVVDELHDLMMVAGRAVEDAIVRIAQMARAVGIHLVVATQRPSVDVITGVIKANIPSRLAFAVASQADSRVILDTGGAEKLIGDGDMIMVTAREPKPERVQGAWVSEPEVHAVVGWVREQQKAQYEQTVLEAPEASVAENDEYEGEDPDIMRQAIDLVVRSQLGSTSMLQRKLRIGFARAGRVMDIMERRGIVGPSEGSKARTVLVTVEELPDILGEPATH